MRASCFFKEKIADYEAGQPFDPAAPLNVPAAADAVLVRVFCNARDSSGLKSDDLEATITVTVGGRSARSVCVGGQLQRGFPRASSSHACARQATRAPVTAPKRPLHTHTAHAHTPHRTPPSSH